MARKTCHNPGFPARLGLTGLFMAGAMLFLIWRLWQLQMTQSYALSESVQRQCIRSIRLEPVRGRIFAADNVVLADSRAVFDLAFHPAEMRQPGPRLNTLNYILKEADALALRVGRPSLLTFDQLKRHISQSPARELVVFQNLTPKEMACLSEIMPPPRGIEITARILRRYPHPGLASHVLGFTGRRQPEPDLPETAEFGSAPIPAYTLPELIGRDGLEKIYESELAGHAGRKLVMVNNRGYIHSEVGDPVPPVNGNDLILTLDSRAQAAAELALAGRTGALVMVDVHTGGILAMASSPTYDLSDLSHYGELAADRVNKPLLNRALSGRYQPGSILKPLIALAALQSGAVSADSPVVDCHGAHLFSNNSAIRCWRTGGHGPVALEAALERSCNSYFIEAGLKTGFDAQLQMLRAAGLGADTGVDMPGADTGFLPSRDWAQKEWKRPWMAIDTAFLSIGQGPISLTPLQAAIFTAAIANGGSVFRPHIVQSTRDADGNLCRSAAPAAPRRLPVMQSQLELVRRGMRDVITGADGTGKAAHNEFMSLAGKTGTAEVDVRPGERIKNTWFIGYAPADQPRYALALIIERGESGGHTAAPLVRRFFTAWLGKNPDAVPAFTPAADPAAGD